MTIPTFFSTGSGSGESIATSEFLRLILPLFWSGGVVIQCRTGLTSFGMLSGSVGGALVSGESAGVARREGSDVEGEEGVTGLIK